MFISLIGFGIFMPPLCQSTHSSLHFIRTVYNLKRHNFKRNRDETGRSANPSGNSFLPNTTQYCYIKTRWKLAVGIILGGRS